MDLSFALFSQNPVSCLAGVRVSVSTRCGLVCLRLGVVRGSGLGFSGYGLETGLMLRVVELQGLGMCRG